MKLSDHNISLQDFFRSFENLPYVLMKSSLDDLLDKEVGGDLDLFCFQPENMARIIQSEAKPLLKNGFELKISNREEWHRHIDLLKGGELILRFDLYGDLPVYKKVNLKKQLFASVIENAQAVKWPDEDAEIFIPAEIDKALFAYIEYIEFYEDYPDKIKHLNYLLAEIEKDQSRISFLDKLHFYTDLPKPADYKNQQLVNGGQHGSIGYHMNAISREVINRILYLPLLRPCFLGLKRLFIKSG